jgi:hypothetical protein
MLRNVVVHKFSHLPNIVTGTKLRTVRLGKRVAPILKRRVHFGENTKVLDFYRCDCEELYIICCTIGFHQRFGETNTFQLLGRRESYTRNTR